MKRFRTLTTTAMSLLALAFAAPASDAYGQAVKELVGSWTLISVKVDQGGQMVEPFGASPKGALMFDRNGRFLAINRSDLPKIVQQSCKVSRENRAIVQGSIATGTYTVSAGRSFVYVSRAVRSPNWVGTDQETYFQHHGDEPGGHHNRIGRRAREPFWWSGND
jgi:hypothetical protein